MICYLCLMLMAAPQRRCWVTNDTVILTGFIILKFLLQAELMHPVYEFAETSPYFQTAWKADSVINRFARERGTAIFVFTDARIDLNARIAAELDRGD